MFDFFKNKEQKWNESYDLLADGKISLQKFVDRNEKMPLYNTLPFFADENGKGFPNAIGRQENDVMYFPVFFSVEEMKKHYSAHGVDFNMIIEGTLKSVLSSLDSHPVIRGWGVVVSPDSKRAIWIPPFTRVTPKCLR